MRDARQGGMASAGGKAVQTAEDAVKLQPLG